MVNVELQLFSLLLLYNIQGDFTVMVMLKQEKPVCGGPSKKLGSPFVYLLQDFQLFSNLHAKTEGVGGFCFVLVVFLFIFFFGF